MGVRRTLTLVAAAIMACVCVQPSSLATISRAWRWGMFLVAMAETMLWSGTIFGWASLVHVLKLQGVYSNLCPIDQPNTNHTPSIRISLTATHHTHKVSPAGARSSSSRAGVCLGLLTV